MVKLALPTFVTGPQDELEAVDVYDLQSVGPSTQIKQTINSIQRLVNSGSEQVSTAMRGGRALADQVRGQLAVIQGIRKGILEFRKDNLITRIAASSKELTAQIKGASNLLKGKIGDNIPKNGNIFAKIGAIEQKVNAIALTDLSAVGRIIQDVSGIEGLFSVEDQEGRVGLYAGLIQEANRFGIKNSFDALMAGVEDTYMLGQVAARSLPSVIRTSDVDSLKAIAAKLPQERVAMIHPTVVPEFAKEFKKNVGESAEAAKDTWDKVQSAIGSISPKCFVCTRKVPGFEEGEDVLSVDVIQNGSKDFQQMAREAAINSEQMEDKLKVLGTVFKPQSVDDQLIHHFPYTVTGAEQRSTAQVADPRTLTFPAMAPKMGAEMQEMIRRQQELEDQRNNPQLPTFTRSVPSGGMAPRQSPEMQRLLGRPEHLVVDMNQYLRDHTVLQ